MRKCCEMLYIGVKLRRSLEGSMMPPNSKIAPIYGLTINIYYPSNVVDTPSIVWVR